MIGRFFVGLTALALLTTSGMMSQGTAMAAGSSAPAAATCSGQRACSQIVLHILNADRAQFHVAPLNLLKIQTYGTHSCVGSLGHSQAMAETDSLWHSRASKPNASFPHNICVAYTTVGENIGESQSGDEVGDLTTINDMMMQEPHSHAVCASTINHACNILNGQFHHVGIGVVFSNGTTWLTEDFTN